MNSFLYEVAVDILKKYQQRDKIALVVFNKRTGENLRNAYKSLTNNDFTPDIYVLEAFVRKLTDLKNTDKLSMLFELYEITQKCFHENAVIQTHLESFDSFYHLGNILLDDFDEIDAFLADVKQIFLNIKDISTIDTIFEYFSEEQIEILQTYWKNFSIEKNSKEKERLIELWNEIPNIYQRFTQTLLQRQEAYNGLMYRKLAKMIEENSLKISKYKTIIFVGFNALNKGQFSLFKHLKYLDLAKFYWDVDSYYLRDFRQEAGHFLRQNLKDFPNEISLPSNILSVEKKIELIGVPLEVGQAKVIPNLLSKISETSQNATAIVLCNEFMLFPVLYSLPADVEKISVAMDYSLKNSTLYSFLEQYFRMQKMIRKNREGIIIFYFKEVIALLRQSEVWNRTKDLAANLISEIQINKKIYPELEYLMSKENSLFHKIFLPVALENDGQRLLSQILEILTELYNTLPQKNNLESEILAQMYRSIKELQEIIKTKIFSNQKIGCEVAIKLLRKVLAEIKISFESEKNELLQIISMGETRNVDFENIIVLGLNEGIMPVIRRRPTFVAESLRFAFGLPVVKHQDSIYAYLFYRLLQRSKNIFLLYNNITSSDSGELSRFVQQLIYEWETPIEHRHFKQDMMPLIHASLEIQKTESVYQGLAKYFQTENTEKIEFSASAINCWLDCKLQFYFRYIARIPEPKNVEEEISLSDFGSLLHESIESLYRDRVLENKNSLISLRDLEVLKSRIDFYIEKSFRKHFYIDENKKFVYEGNQLIIKEVMKNYIEIILETDKKYLPFEVISLEEGWNCRAEFEIEIFGKKEKVGLKGVIDRLDCKDGIFRIIDYKTGSIDLEFSSVENLFSPESKKRNGAILQTFLYGLLLLKRNNFAKVPLFPALYSLRDMQNDEFSPLLIQKQEKERIPVTENNFKNYLPEFEELLLKTLQEIFDSEIPFSQTDEKETCRYCKYSAFCNIEN